MRSQEYSLVVDDLRIKTVTLERLVKELTNESQALFAKDNALRAKITNLQDELKEKSMQVIKQEDV